MSECQGCNCKDFDKCQRYLHLVLDGEATPEQEKYFYSHIEKCIVCFSQYNIELQIRELVKTKLSKKRIPTALLEEIKAKII